MNTLKFKTLMKSVVAVAIVGMAGCRTHMPHAFTWPAGGDTIQTHPKPPEGGYYSNWDPYAVSLEVYPENDVNAVRTQHVIVATVKDKDGKPLINRRVEWMIAEGSVGDIVEVDESGWRASRGYKVDNHFAVSHTNNFAHVLDMGNDDPSDDIQLTKGQTWCVITSPIEGTSNVTVYAPGIYDWAKHKVFVTKHWFDVKWDFPMPATNPTGTTHEFVTMVAKHSDGSPLENYIVNYEILDGPAGVFTNSGSTKASVRTDATGAAVVTLAQSTPAPGTNNIKIDIVRPPNEACCKPGVHIATGHTSKTWIPPEINITKTAPAEERVNNNFNYDIVVTNPSSVDAQNVMVTDVLPDGISYVSSQPAANVSGQSLSWSLGTVAGGGQQALSVTVNGTRTGTFHNCADVRADQGLSDQDCADTRITAPQLVLEKTCPAEVTTCDPIPCTIVVRNTGDGPATNVTITDDLPDGLVTDNGRRTVQFNVGTLNAGEARKGDFVAKAERVGSFTNRATATADDGLTASADCTTVVTQPVLTVSKTGPGMRFIGRPAEYQITVTNTGNSPAVSTVLTDTLPSSTTFISATEGGSASGGTISWNLGTLGAGESRTVNVTVKATQAGTIRNVATARAVCADASDEAVMEVKGIPAILLEVIDVEDPIEVGGTITYVITVTNQGSAVGTNIKISAEVPGQQDFVSADGPTAGVADGRSVTFAPLPSLAPRAKATYRVVAKGNATGDTRFRVSMISDQMDSTVDETESTNIY